MITGKQEALPDIGVQGVPITRVRENLVYKNRFARFYDDDVLFSNGRPGTYFRIAQGSGQPGVVIFPVAGEYMALVRTWRYAVSAWEWGLPRGNAHGDDPEESARNELAEELGSVPLEMLLLGRTRPDSSHLETEVFVYAARFSPDAMDALPEDTEEIAEARWITVDSLPQRIAAGEICDGFTLAGYGLWRAWQDVSTGSGTTLR